MKPSESTIPSAFEEVLPCTSSCFAVFSREDSHYFRGCKNRAFGKRYFCHLPKTGLFDESGKMTRLHSTSRKKHGRWHSYNAWFTKSGFFATLIFASQYASHLCRSAPPNAIRLPMRYSSQCNTPPKCIAVLLVTEAKDCQREERPAPLCYPDFWLLDVSSQAPISPCL